ncbi:MAG TPA: hypothetical protein VKC66_07115 [Xanthobacteraceae bacterium]|nr:hypothetical protein [Xanthobacteraceae bacterium]
MSVSEIRAQAGLQATGFIHQPGPIGGNEFSRLTCNLGGRRAELWIVSRRDLQRRRAIEIFVYPQAWPTYVQWVGDGVVQFSRGAEELSLDHVVWQRASGLGGEAAPGP